MRLLTLYKKVKIVYRLPALNKRNDNTVYKGLYLLIIVALLYCTYIRWMMCVKNKKNRRYIKKMSTNSIIFTLYGVSVYIELS